MLILVYKNKEIEAKWTNYGLQLIIGEIPKMFITIAIAYLLGVFKLTLITILIILPICHSFYHFLFSGDLLLT